MERSKKKERSVTPEKKRRIDSPNDNTGCINARDRQRDERSSRSSVPRQKDTSRDTLKRVEESSKSRRKPIDIEPNPKSELISDRKQGERQNGTGRHRKSSVNELEDEDARSDSNKNSDTHAVEERPELPAVMPQRFVHDSSSISRTPSPFLSAAERDPELMIGTLVEKLALKRQLQQTKQAVAKEANSSSSDEEEERDAPKRSKFELTEGGEEAPKTSSKKAKKAKKSKKSKKSKKEKRTDLDSRDALEKQLRERALKSMRKHKLAE